MDHGIHELYPPLDILISRIFQDTQIRSFQNGKRIFQILMMLMRLAYHHDERRTNVPHDDVGLPSPKDYVD